MPQVIHWLAWTTNESGGLDRVHFWRVKLQENQTGDASWFLGLYILSYCMYMLVSNLPILSRASIMEIKNMIWPRGGGRMEEKHEHVWYACVWQHSHAQHGNELSRIRLSLIEQGSPWGKHVFMKMWRVWDKWALVESLLTVQSLQWLDKIRWKEKID